jgi:hypothetical protein
LSPSASYTKLHKEVVRMTAVVLDVTVRDLADADLAACGFAGSELHLTQVAKQLDRARYGEVDYPRARALYERLGYVAYDEILESWDQQNPDGLITRYETTCAQMRKELT